MKKILVSLAIISSILLVNSSLAYSPNNYEKKRLSQIKSEIKNINETAGPIKLIRIKNQINKLIEKNRENERNMYILRQIKNELIPYIEKYQKELEIKKQKEEKKKSSVSSKTDLLNKYSKEISGEISSSCMKHYDFIDSIAKEQNFPTALIIAMWKKEHNCHLDNPANGWGAFQITSRYYTPGAINLDEFKLEILDFIAFSKNKIAYYNKDSGKFKAIFGNTDIVLTYEKFSIRDLRLYALLYNGIRKTTDLNTFLFANANLNSSLKSNSDGIVTSFIKVLKWETK